MSVLSRIYGRLYRKLSGDQRIIPLPPKLTKNFQDPTKIKVFILTYCKNKKQLYGTTLIFQSIRVGFPHAIVTIIDNASVPSARKEIKRLATNTHCQYFQLEFEIPHQTYLEDILINQPITGTVVNLDPDVILWKNCESWHFDALLAGSFMPTHIDEWTQCIVHPRIHSSFYWIQDIGKFRKKVAYLKTTYRDEFDPFRPFTFKEGKHWHRFDTGGVLYSAIKNDCHSFTKEEHGAFDHIFGGTHLNLFINSIQIPKTKRLLLDVHTLAKTDLSKLRGIWKKQFKQLRKPN